MAGETLRFSRFIHLRRFSLACFSGPMEPDTSVKSVAWTERWPKSSRNASLMASLCPTRRPMARSSQSMRFSALGGPSFRCAWRWRSRTRRISAPASVGFICATLMVASFRCLPVLVSKSV